MNENSAIYDAGQSWHELPQVLAYMSEDVPADPTTWWVRDVQERCCSEPLGTRLVVHCGNGWVE